MGVKTKLGGIGGVQASLNPGPGQYSLQDGGQKSSGYTFGVKTGSALDTSKLLG
jgi:hypothetical protein